MIKVECSFVVRGIAVDAVCSSTDGEKWSVSAYFDEVAVMFPVYTDAGNVADNARRKFSTMLRRGDFDDAL